MSDQEKDISRVKGLIFESVSRSDLFETLLGEVDELMRIPRARAITELSEDFADASQTAGRAAATGYGVPEIRFTLDAAGHVQNGTATAVALFGLIPGEALIDRLGESGQMALADLISGQRGQVMFTLFADPQSRPVLVFAQNSEGGSIDAFAILLQWNNAIAPYLRDGFGLTEAEIDVVEHIFRGSSPKEIARRRDRALDTVRTQLRAICRKTDTHGIGDLVHLIYGLIATVPHLKDDNTPQVQGRYMLKLPSGRAIDLETTGPVTGKPLLFLHGCLGGRRLPPAALSALSDRRIIAPGRPGHGQSRVLDGSATPLEDTVSDLLALLDELGIERTQVLAYDLGTPFALWLADQAPQRVESVTCLAPVPSLAQFKEVMQLPAVQRVFPLLSRVNSGAARYLAQLGGQRILRKGPEGFGQIVFAGAEFDQQQLDETPDIQNLFWHGHAWHTERGPAGFLADAELAARPWEKTLGRLQMPVQFLIGAEDRNIPYEALTRLAERVGANLEKVPDAGHSILHAAPAQWLSRAQLLLQPD